MVSLLKSYGSFVEEPGAIALYILYDVDVWVVKVVLFFLSRDICAEFQFM